jgi:hypothetical protein
MQRTVRKHSTGGFLWDKAGGESTLAKSLAPCQKIAIQ